MRSLKWVRDQRVAEESRGVAEGSQRVVGESLESCKREPEELQKRAWFRNVYVVCGDPIGKALARKAGAPSPIQRCHHLSLKNNKYARSWTEPPIAHKECSGGACATT